MIGEEPSRNKGIGTYATKTMINHAFNHLNLHRIELEVLATNKEAYALYEKSGFVKEGVKRQAVFKNGKYIDVIFMSLLREELIEP